MRRSSGGVWAVGSWSKPRSSLDMEAEDGRLRIADRVWRMEGGGLRSRDGVDEEGRGGGGSGG